MLVNLVITILIYGICTNPSHHFYGIPDIWQPFPKFLNQLPSGEGKEEQKTLFSLLRYLNIDRRLFAQKQLL